MLDKVVYFLSEAFRKEGLLVPFGTTYRIAEDLIENMDGKELVLCKDCKKEWCYLRQQLGGDGFCSAGERKD